MALSLATRDTSFSSRTKQCTKVLNNMSEHINGNSAHGLLLTGDPGVGKTSFVQFFGALIGIDMIVIEAPHISEEHLINIPFLVVKTDGKKIKDALPASESQYDVIMAKSNLLTRMEECVVEADKAYLARIYKNVELRTVFENLGGTKTSIPEEFELMRKKFKCILFLDEFFRQTSNRVRNILRGLMNNKVGTDDLPKWVYIVYATNLDDSSGEAIETIDNEEFNHFKFKAPNKDDWFSYLMAKFDKSKNSDDTPKLNMAVVEKFYQVLTEEHLNFKDASSGVRSSPRRWEQLILYISAGIPCHDEADARSLLTNVKNNFKDYETGNYSTLFNVVALALVDLIESTSGIRIAASSVNPDTGWRDTLHQQIEAKIKLGKARKYVPILAGPPGVGKTAEAHDLATKMDMGFVQVDISAANADDATGLALPAAGGPSKGIKFSEPPLYRIIMNGIQRVKGDVHDFHKPYNYLLLLDEFSRPRSVSVYNTMRQVLLEGTFGAGYDLPEDVMVIAAMNPSGGGTTPLTSHMKDVVDVIDTKMGWDKSLRFMDEMKFPKDYESASVSVTKTVFSLFVAKFQTHDTTIAKDQHVFYIVIGGVPVYFSARRYTGLYSACVTAVNALIKRAKPTTNLKQAVREELYDCFESSLENAMHNATVKSEEFLYTLKQWFLHSAELNDVDNALGRKPSTYKFTDIIGNYFEGSKSDMSEDQTVMNFILAASKEPVVFRGEFSSFVLGTFKTLDDVKHYLMVNNKPNLEMNASGDIEVKGKTSQFVAFIKDLANAIKLYATTNELMSDLLEVLYADALMAATDAVPPKEHLIYDAVTEAITHCDNYVSGLHNIKV